MLSCFKHTCLPSICLFMKMYLYLCNHPPILKSFRPFYFICADSAMHWRSAHCLSRNLTQKCHNSYDCGGASPPPPPPPPPQPPHLLHVLHMPFLYSELGYMKTRGYDKAHLNSVQTEWGKKSFAFKAAQEWNSLPAELREIKSTVVFRKHLKSVFLDQQFC